MAQLPSKPSQKFQPWSEDDELNLLAAVLEIAKEPAESYEPGINLFDRIGKILNKSFTNKEVLGKINELKTRCEEKYRDVQNQESMSKTSVFEMGVNIWGDEMMKDKDKEQLLPQAQSMANVHDIEDHQVFQAENQQTAEPKSTASVMGTISLKASRHELKRACEAIKEEDDKRSKNENESGKPLGKKNKSNFPEEEKTVNILTKQQEHEEIPKDTISLQFESKNKPDEQPSAPVSASSEIDSHQVKSRQIEQKKEVSNNPETGSHQLKSLETEQRKEAPNNSNTGSHQLRSQQTDQRKETSNSKTGSHQLKSQHTEQRKSVPNKSNTGSHQISSEKKEVNVSNSQPSTHRLTSKKKKGFKRFKAGSHQLVPPQWITGPPRPFMLRRPSTWGPPVPTALPYPPPPAPYRYPPPPTSYRYPPPTYPMFNHRMATFNPSPTENRAWFSPRR